MKNLVADLLWCDPPSLGTVVVEIVRRGTGEFLGAVDAGDDPGVAHELRERLQVQAERMTEREFLDAYGGPA